MFFSPQMQSLNSHLVINNFRYLKLAQKVALKKNTAIKWSLQNEEKNHEEQWKFKICVLFISNSAQCSTNKAVNNKEEKKTGTTRGSKNLICHPININNFSPRPQIKIDSIKN